MEVRITCEKCGGTGTDPSPCVRYDDDGHELPYDDTCTNCAGVGYFVNDIEESELTAFIADQEKFREEVEDKLNDILDKCNDIFEKVNE